MTEEEKKKSMNDVEKSSSSWMLLAAIGTGVVFWGSLALVLWWVLTR